MSLRGGDAGVDAGRLAAFGLLQDGCPIVGGRESGGMLNNTASVVFDIPVHADGYKTLCYRRSRGVEAWVQ